MLTYKLFNAMQVSSGMIPYQQSPPQFGWSQSRTPPRLRLRRGVAFVVVSVRVETRRVLRGEGIFFVGVVVGCESVFGCVE